MSYLQQRDEEKLVMRVEALEQMVKDLLVNDAVVRSMLSDLMEVMRPKIMVPK